VQKTYSYEPVPKELTAAEAKHVLGAQGNVWTEYMKNTKKVEYMIFPRMSALSEVLWSPKALRSWPDFEKRLQVQFRRYDLWGANYSKAYFDLKASINPAKDGNGVVYTLESSSPTGKIHYPPSAESSLLVPYTTPFHVRSSKRIGAVLLVDDKPVSSLWQSFLINKATGKAITVATPTAENRRGNGGNFGLLNGIRTEKGGIGSEEWLGWQGPDMEAVIDLGKAQSISSVDLHVLEQTASWVYLPQYAEVYASADGKTWKALGKGSDVVKEANNAAVLTVPFSPTTARYVKVVARNYGAIPAGQPGAGSAAWLFVDEIAVN
jgi:hexosaminidase